MSSNPNNKGKGGGQGPRKRGFIFGAILWALVLVIFFNFLAKQIANAGTKEVPYSEFIQMVEEDKVATVELTSNKYTFYLKEDLPTGAGEGGSQDLAEVLAQQMEQGGATRYVTAPVVARDDSLISLLKEHDVEYYSPMQEESSYLMSLLLSYVVPMILMVGLQFFVKNTRTGKAMRAVSEDQGAAQLMGVNVNNTISITFAIGCGLAAVGAMFYAQKVVYIKPLLGSLPGLKAFVAAVLGGIGSIPGAVLGGFMIGIAETFMKYYASEYVDAMVFGILILVLLFKPSGLLGKKSKEKV